jgi:hypothetical protein
MEKFWWMVAVAALSGCQPKEISLQVQIITSSCDPKVNPFAGVEFLRVRITGEGIETPIDSIAATGGAVHELKIPEIPAGKARVIEIRGYDSDPHSAAKVLSIGKSAPIDVPDVIADPSNNEPLAVNVFLRKVDAYTPPSSANSPKDCQRMKVPRAGHTATLLKNGKVFIAGGYNFKQTSTEKQSLSDTEIYNPFTNAFESSREMSIANGVQRIPKAFHTATRLKSGQVLLWGGETYSGGVNNNVSPAAIILIYDADANDYGAVRSRVEQPGVQPASIPRTHHSAAIDSNGKVLIVGGENRPPVGTGLAPEPRVEWFDPATNDYKVIDGVSLPRKEPSVAPVKGGELIGVAGGSDGTAMTTEVAFFKWSGTAYVREVLTTPPRLAQPGRRAAAVATLRDGVDLLVLGGYSDVTQVKPIASSEIIGTANTTVAPGPVVGARGDICATQLQDGSILALGGLTVDAIGDPPYSSPSSVLIKSDAQGGAIVLGGPALPVPRYQHTCTTLPDGTVLVLGGVNEANHNQEILQDAWIYQPGPKD